jgi:hypothetical protein
MPSLQPARYAVHADTEAGNDLEPGNRPTNATAMPSAAVAAAVMRSDILEMNASLSAAS